MLLQNMMVLGAMAKMKLRSFFTDERGEVNIVSIVVLCGVAVLLAILFKEQISKLIETLIGQITGNATNAVNNGAVGE